MDYIEKEVKILDINISELVQQLTALGAAKVFEDFRIISTYDNKLKTLQSSGIDIRITEEGETKLSLDQKTQEGKSSIKLKISRKKEMNDFLSVLEIEPVAQAKAKRISFEFRGVDFDIDQFEGIPAFLEIDLGESSISLEEILNSLDLEDKEVVNLSTQEIYKKYGKDYLVVNSI